MPIWKILHHPVFIAIITLATVILCVSLYLGAVRLRSSNQKVLDLQTEVTQKAKDVEKLHSTLEEVKQETSQEKIIRDQLLMQKPGESVVQIPDLPPPTPVAESEKEVKTPLQEWRDVFFRGDSQ